MNSERIAWVDYCKLLGIILVVLGHCLPSADTVKVVLYSFHVPFFFLLSGYVCGYTENDGFGERIKARFARLIGPYAIYTILSLPAYFWGKEIELNELIKRTWFYQGRVIWNDPLWFLVTLFLVEVVFILVVAAFRKKHEIALAVLAILFLVSGFFVYQAGVKPDYFGYCKVLFLFPFYIAGYFARKKHWLKRLPKVKGFPWVGAAIVAVMMGLAAVLNYGDNISIYTFDLNSYWILVLTSLVISFGIMYCISHIDKRWKFLQFASRYTLFIMCSHYFLLFLWDKLDFPSSLAGRWLEFIAVAVTYSAILGILYWREKRKKNLKYYIGERPAN